jgi:hypothetical protein
MSPIYSMPYRRFFMATGIVGGALLKLLGKALYVGKKNVTPTSQPSNHH